MTTTSADRTTETLHQLATSLRGELIPSRPEELSGWIALLTVPPVPLFPGSQG